MLFLPSVIKQVCSNLLFFFTFGPIDSWHSKAHSSSFSSAGLNYYFILRGVNLLKSYHLFVVWPYISDSVGVMRDEKCTHNFSSKT